MRQNKLRRRLIFRIRLRATARWPSTVIRRMSSDAPGHPLDGLGHEGPRRAEVEAGETTSLLAEARAVAERDPATLEEQLGWIVAQRARGSRATPDSRPPAAGNGRSVGTRRAARQGGAGCRPDRRAASRATPRPPRTRRSTRALRGGRRDSEAARPPARARRSARSSRRRVRRTSARPGSRPWSRR